MLVWRFSELPGGPSLELLKEVRQQVRPRAIRRANPIRQLVKVYRQGKLVLVLGAGVSIDYKLPSWPFLLQGLLLHTLQKGNKRNDELTVRIAELFTEVFNQSPLIAARYLRLHTETELFEENVRNILYANLLDEKDSDTMKEVRQLAAAVNSPRLDSIITYNFDDILETCLKRSNIKIPYQTIYDIQIKPKSNALPIYHVHGFLPREGPIDPSNEIVLSEDTYHMQYTDIYNWKNLVQINKFRENTCLFIGLSFSDPNLRRLLDIAQKQRGGSSVQHFLIRERYSVDKIIEKIKEGQSVSENGGKHNMGKISKARKRKSQNEQDKPPNKVQIDIKELASELVNLMQEFEEKDASSFGVSIIWVDKYRNDIPRILRTISESSDS